ncbi:hypothetical protein EUZ85_23555 [Hahella sp. KA22]|uniref:hypothetical protein n=1 Tax=Hahella sp. KA22 TaxID=1628392 RepID=UPI000FDE33E3|nr:hypothetical protein [Hahella sp. KA22]AZZ93537.1 hypothetical protein ENC22_20970 [Hahella sp. KA22]QAY56912.1 hypothetical protein EUZ85_23555 [Hahella sp. KA22]
MKKMDFILNKIKINGFCEGDECHQLFSLLTMSLAQKLGVKILFDVQPITNNYIVGCIGYTAESSFGCLDVSLLVNVIVNCSGDRPSIIADVMVYSGSVRLDQTYGFKHFSHFEYDYESSGEWIFIGWKADEYGGYDSFRQLDE